MSLPCIDGIEASTYFIEKSKISQNISDLKKNKIKRKITKNEKKERKIKKNKEKTSKNK